MFERQGVFLGAPIDLADGYIHLSAAHQLLETLDKHFTGQAGLVVIGFDPDALGPALVWEPSRGGALFPHLYAALPLAAARSRWRAAWDGEKHGLARAD
jgi:uncharacterized protein (DUF952 family)